MRDLSDCWEGLGVGKDGDRWGFVKIYVVCKDKWAIFYCYCLLRLFDGVLIEAIPLLPTLLDWFCWLFLTKVLELGWLCWFWFP